MHMHMYDPLLPDYSPSPPAPAYSFEPSSSEQRLELTPRQGRSRAHLTGNIFRRLRKATLVLQDQEDEAEIPSYGRNDVINGVLCFDDPANITDVVVKICGAIETAVSEFGAKKRLVNDSYTLWKSDATNSRCPSQLAFSCILPSTFIEDDGERSLPPSFYLFVPGFYVKVHYWIAVDIIRTRHWKVDFWPSVKRHSVPFNYRPRSRPCRPIIDIPCFLSCIKTLPEEWYQATAPLKTRPFWQAREPLYCHFFVPSARIYGLSDTIPFHIQLNGPISSLRQFFPPDALQRIKSTDSSLSIFSKNTISSKGQAPKERHPCVRVLLIRQVSVVRNGSKVWQNSNIGEGVVYPLPPPLIRDACLGTREESLDWKGHIRCNEDVAVGTLVTNLVQSQHFLSLVFTPPEPHMSPFIELTTNISIKLVSDSYSEIG